MVLEKAENKELFLWVVARAKTKYDFRLENFCIMGNHFHFLIKPGRGESLSAIMRWILSVFAIWYNKRHKLTGHLWGERFYSKIISGLREFLLIFNYIDENPRRANLVDDIRQWRWGGLWHDQMGITLIIDTPVSWLRHFYPGRWQSPAT
jgi:Transposase and inactivated derivatives